MDAPRQALPSRALSALKAVRVLAVVDAGIGACISADICAQEPRHERTAGVIGGMPRERRARALRSWCIGGRT